MRRFRLCYEPARCFVAADVGCWRVVLLLSLFWLQRSQWLLWWDGGASPILRVGPVVLTYWRKR